MSFFQSFLLVSGFSSLAFAQTQNAQFNQVINLNGNMQLNSFTFPDNSKIETFSQTQQQVLVNQNPISLSANHVVGSTGQPFVQLSQNSLVIETNNATSLVGAQIELAMDQNMLQQNNINPDNTFVAMLSSDRQAWIVMEGIKSVNSTDSTVRMVKLNSIDGEYMAIGRQTVETSQVLTPFGNQVNINGSGIQEVEFTDGFRMSVQATQPMTVRTDVANGISSSMTTALNGAMSVNNFRYLVTTNLGGVTTGLNQMNAVVQLPLNAVLLMKQAQTMNIGSNGSVSLGIAQRSIQQNPGGATGQLSPQKRGLFGRKASSAASSASSASPTVAEASSAPSSAASSAPSSASSDTASTSSNTTSSSSSESASSSNSISSSSSQTDGSSTTGQQPQAQGQSSPSATSPQDPAATQLLLSPTFTPINAKVAFDPTNNRLAVPVSQVSGEFILTMGSAAGAGAGASTGSTLQRRQLHRRQQPAQNGIVMSMSDLAAMAQRQQNGGAAFLATELIAQASQQKK